MNDFGRLLEKAIPLVLSDPESGKCILLTRSEPAGRGAIERALRLEINPLPDHGS